MKIQMHPFDQSKVDVIVQFSTAHPWKPSWSGQFIREFLTQLISHDDLVFDLFSSGLYSSENRVACAVLIDKVSNLGNNACLEFLGIKPGLDLVQLYELVLKKAKGLLPPSRSGIELTIHESLNLPEAFFRRHALDLYYSTSEMHRSLTAPIEPFDSSGIRTLKETDFEETYPVVVESFKLNLDTAIPSFSDWKQAHLTRSHFVTWIYEADHKILGFLNLLLNPNTNETEVRTVGVLPQARRKGIGRRLLLYALDYAKRNEFLTCHLTVATKNETALNLYQELGFAVYNQYRVFQWKK